MIPSTTQQELGYLIAATALEYGMTVLTANIKHFGTVDRWQVEAFVP